MSSAPLVRRSVCLVVDESRDDANVVLDLVWQSVAIYAAEDDGLGFLFSESMDFGGKSPLDSGNGRRHPHAVEILAKFEMLALLEPVFEHPIPDPLNGTWRRFD